MPYSRPSGALSVTLQGTRANAEVEAASADGAFTLTSTDISELPTGTDDALAAYLKATGKAPKPEKKKPEEKKKEPKPTKVASSTVKTEKPKKEVSHGGTDSCRTLRVKQPMA